VTRNTLRRRARETARAVAPALPRGAYLLRFEPAAASTEAAQFSRCIRQALTRAGRAAQVAS
jgi:RNase P protein component